MPRFTKRLKRKFLGVFGDIKLSWWPLWISYQAGDYYGVSGEESRKVAVKIRPGDVVMRNYRNYLDCYFIPGKYTHTGVYYGKGKLIHAVTEGVVEVDLYDFLRCDRYIVLRPRTGVKQALARLVSYLGRPYDIDFYDGEDQLYCHEVAAEAYKELGIQKIQPGGLAKWLGVGPKFLDDSIIMNPNFRVVIAGGK